AGYIVGRLRQAVTDPPVVGSPVRPARECARREATQDKPVYRMVTQRNRAKGGANWPRWSGDLGRWPRALCWPPSSLLFPPEASRPKPVAPCGPFHRNGFVIFAWFPGRARIWWQGPVPCFNRKRVNGLGRNSRLVARNRNRLQGVCES